jgi:exonuclease III
MLMEVHTVDILCVQETWLSPSTVELHVPGFQVLEQRREKGKRGGLAILIRKGVKVATHMGNEYA